MDRDGFLAAPGTVPCVTCGAMLNPNGHRPAETYAGTATGECYRCQARAPFKRGAHASGAEIWSHAAHCPSYRRDRELYTWWPGCAAPGCDHGRRIRYDGFAGSSYATNCRACLDEHEKHPATVEERRVHAAQRAASALWLRRMVAEVEQRAGMPWPSDQPDTFWFPIRDAVLADGPAEPTGETCPEFPEGWALDPKAGPVKGRKRRKG